MSFRGKTAIVGIGETAHKRSWPDRSSLGLAAEAAAEAIADAGLRREDIDGLMTVASSFNASRMAEYIGIRPTAFAVAAGFQGATPGVSITIAAAVLQAGIANYILFVNGNARDPENPEGMVPIPERPNFASEFLAP